MSGIGNHIWVDVTPVTSDGTPPTWGDTTFLAMKHPTASARDGIFAPNQAGLQVQNGKMRILVTNMSNKDFHIQKGYRLATYEVYQPKEFLLLHTTPPACQSNEDYNLRFT